MGNMRRRNFLKVTFGALTVGPVVARAAAFGAYDRVRLGRSGIETSRLCFGTGYKAFNRVSEQTRLGHDAFVALLRAGYERGIRCFDAADLYGSHRPLAEALKPFPRDRYTLISKIWWRKGGVPEEDKTAVPEQIRLPERAEDRSRGYRAVALPDRRGVADGTGRPDGGA